MTKKCTGFMNMILSHSDHLHISATHVAIFRVVKTSKEI